MKILIEASSEISQFLGRTSEKTYNASGNRNKKYKYYVDKLEKLKNKKFVIHHKDSNYNNNNTDNIIFMPVDIHNKLFANAANAFEDDLKKISKDEFITFKYDMARYSKIKKLNTIITSYNNQVKDEHKLKLFNYPILDVKKFILLDNSRNLSLSDNIEDLIDLNKIDNLNKFENYRDEIISTYMINELNQLMTKTSFNNESDIIKCENPILTLTQAETIFKTIE